MVKDKNINKKKTKKTKRIRKNKKTKNKKLITKKVNKRTKKISIKKKKRRKILRGGLTYNNLIKKTPLKYIDRGYKSLKKK